MNEDDPRFSYGHKHILSGHRPLRPDQWLRGLASMPAAQRPPDFLGNGGAVSELEQRVAALLGKEQAVFVAKGMIAQLATLKTWSDIRSTTNVAIHRLSHIDMDESNALESVGGLRPVRLGRFAPFGFREVDALTERLAALVIELPLRRAGYLLPPIDELRAISAHCRDRHVPLHFDGARIWEAAAGYNIGVAELASLADTIYVSFYKGLGAPGGAAICASADFVQSLAVWKSRLGGNLITAFPYALGALSGMDNHIPRMPDYVARSRQLAARLRERMLVNPGEPHVNAFQLILRGSPDELSRRHSEFAERTGVWLFNGFGDSVIDGRSTAEIVVGDCSDEWKMDEAIGWLESFMQEHVADC